MYRVCGLQYVRSINVFVTIKRGICYITLSFLTLSYLILPSTGLHSIALDYITLCCVALSCIASSTLDYLHIYMRMCEKMYIYIYIDFICIHKQVPVYLCINERVNLFRPCSHFFSSQVWCIQSWNSPCCCPWPSCHC